MTERDPEGTAGWAAPAGWGPPEEGAGPAGAAPGDDPPTTGRAGQGSPHRAPQYGAPQYGAPQYGAPQQGAPQQGQAGWGAPGWGTPPGSSPQDDATPRYGPPAGWGGPPAGPPPPGVVPLRPLGLGELLDGAVGVVRRYPRPTLGLSLATAVLTTGLGLLLITVLPSTLFSAATTRPELSDATIGSSVVSSSATLLVTGLAAIVLSGMITSVVGRAVLGQPMTVQDAWRALRPRLLRLVGLAVVTGLLVVLAVVAGVLLAVLSYAVAGGAGLLLGVPAGIAGCAAGIYLYVRLSLAAPALVLEKVGILEALRRSGVLVRRSFWRVAGVLVLAAMIAGFVSEVIQIPFLVSGGTNLFSRGGQVGTRSLVLLQIGSGIASTLTAPFTSGVRALLYIDRRMRAEGLDVALAAAARG